MTTRRRQLLLGIICDSVLPRLDFFGPAMRRSLELCSNPSFVRDALLSRW
jgi:hypothetical protein